MTPFLAKIANGESVLAFCECNVLLSATATETAHPGVRVCRAGCIDGDFAAISNEGSLKLGETTSYGFVVTSYSGR